MLGSILTRNEHDILTMFMKLKPPVIHDFDTKDAYAFILDYYERWHKLGIVHQYGVDFVSLKHQGEAKQWLKENMDFISYILPPLTWT